MIYLFNESKTLFSIVSREELLSFLYEREVNALYQASVEMPVQSTDKNGLTRNLYNEMQNATYFGHYDLNDKFQLHKIVSIDVTGDSFITTAVHLFFDEAKALAVTGERRFIDRPIEDSVIYAFGLIGWTLDEFDVSDAKTVSFFNDTVLEAQAKIIKTFGFKFDYWLDFDGQKITSKKVKVKKELGTQTHQRYVYGHNALGIKMETDFSEIYTAVLGRGHGERIENLDDEGNETEDTFGRRIEFDEVEWSKSSGDPLDKDLGDRILVDPDSTQIFGYVREDDTVAPRVKVVEFSDIEDKEDLLQASYEWLMENNSPKAVYSVEVLETEELDLGDEVYVVYRDIDFVKSARVSRVVDDLLTDRRAVEFGDSDYFRRNSETSRLQRELQDTKNDSADYIQDLKRQANARIDAEMQQARDDFDQAWLEQEQIIEALELATQEEFTTQYNALYGEIQSTADATWTQAEQEIANMDNAMREDFSVWTGDLENLRNDYLASISDIGGTISGIDLDITNVNNRVDDVFSDVGDIQTFIGDTSQNLNDKLQNISIDFNERIDNINVNTRNLLRGTLFNEGLWVAASSVTLLEDESINYYRFHETGSNVPNIYSQERYDFVENETYRLYLDYRTSDVTELDFINIRSGGAISVPTTFITDYHLNLNTDGQWQTVMIEFVANSTGSGSFLIGTNYNTGTSPKGDIDLRLPYLTTSNNDTWLPHPLDSTQSIEEVTRRITELEDGRHELITRTEYNFDTGVLDGTIREITETVDESSNTIANHEEWFVTNGSNVLQTVDEVSSKVWTTDISNIGANLIPMSRNAWEVGSYWSTSGTDNPDPSRIRLKRDRYISVAKGQSYTISDDSADITALNQIDIFQFEDDVYLGAGTWHNIKRGGQLTFVAEGNQILLGIRPIDGSMMHLARIDHKFNPLKIKLESGTQATPMMGFMSNVEQLANRVTTTVYGTDGLESTVAQHSVKVGEIEGLVTDADGKASQALQTVDGFTNTVTDLSDSVNANVNLLPMFYDNWERGFISSSTGNNAIDGSLTHYRTKGYMAVFEPTQLHFSAPSFDQFEISLRYYDQSHEFIGLHSYRSRNSTFTPPENTRYVRAIFRRVDGDTIWLQEWLYNTKLEVGDKRTEATGAISQLEQRADSISSLVSDANGKASQALQTVDGFEDRVTDAEGNASQALQTVNGFENTVTNLNDRVNANVNLLPMFYDNWERGFISSTSGSDTLNGSLTHYRTKGYMAVHHPTQLHFSAPNFHQFQISLRYYNQDFDFIGWDNYRQRGYTFNPPSDTRHVRAIFRRVDENTIWLQEWLYNTKLEVGDKRTESTGAISQLEQRADAIDLTVQDIDLNGVIRQSDVSVQPTGVTIGSAYLGETEFASMFRVMPNAIEAITDEMRITGNLKVAGDIRSLSMEAVNANIGSLRTSILTSNVINSTHIQSNNALIDEIFADTALINRLTGKTAFINSIEALSLSAVRGDIADLRTRILTSNVINSDHIQANNVLIDTIFGTSALINRLTSKSAFITSIRTIDLSADQVRVGFNNISGNVSINSSGVTIDGGALTVNRADGGVPTVIKGTNPNGITLVPASPPRRDSDFTVEGQYVTASTTTYKTFDFYLFEHMFTQVMVEVALINLSNNPITVALRVQGTDGSTFVGTRTYDLTTSYPGNTKFPRIIINIPGKPTGQRERFFLQARTVTNHGKFGIHTYMVKHMDEAEGFERLEV